MQEEILRGPGIAALRAPQLLTTEHTNSLWNNRAAFLDSTELKYDDKIIAKGDRVWAERGGARILETEICSHFRRVFFR